MVQADSHHRRRLDLDYFFSVTEVGPWKLATALTHHVFLSGILTLQRKTFSDTHSHPISFNKLRSEGNKRRSRHLKRSWVISWGVNQVRNTSVTFHLRHGPVPSCSETMILGSLQFGVFEDTYRQLGM
ncbi:hypothetical protein RRG08_010806 [Elysia crispata]|uniref:Uncharacterized protein n=1 Tax=Elysia crispata TaxID=231223 RepID=A0AAE1DF10_9GAST|nr:hypothetical protein RRG08_010806 [Elysia crispata]